MSAALLTGKLCLVIGMVMPEMSASWKASVPMSPRPTWPVIATTGTESIWASASGVTRFVAPGPDVAIMTPARPAICAYPVAACRRPLLVADQDVADLLRVQQRVVGGQNRTAGDAEDHVDAELLEQADHRLGSTDPLGGHRRGVGGAQGPTGRRLGAQRLKRLCGVGADGVCCRSAHEDASFSVTTGYVWATKPSTAVAERGARRS